MKTHDDSNFFFESDDEARTYAQAAVDVLEHAPNLGLGLDGVLGLGSQGVTEFSCPRESWDLFMGIELAPGAAPLGFMLEFAPDTGSRLVMLLNVCAHILQATALHFGNAKPWGTSPAPWRPDEF